MPQATASDPRFEIESEIEKVLRETESATLSLGENLGKVVREAEQLIEGLKSRIGALGAQGDSSVGAVLDSQVRTVNKFVTLLGDTVGAQDSAAERVLETSRTVAQAAQSVQAISMQSRMLALNTMIEAERLGEQGRPVMVIAQEMRELSENISASNQEITRLATELVPLLDQVKHNIGALRQQTGDFTKRFEAERENIGAATRSLEGTVRETLSAGDQRLANILALSNQSLVDLQSQDIISQRLRRVLRLNGEGSAEDASKPLLDQARKGGPSTREQIESGDATDRFLSESLGGRAPNLDAGSMTMF
jgi:methyl-accepting chemotaxis protein